MHEREAVVAVAIGPIDEQDGNVDNVDNVDNTQTGSTAR
jgi:hypothetical protein